MFLTPRDLTNPTLSADIVIVGAGAAGIAIAQALHARKKDILLVEGGSFDIEDDAQRLFDVQTIGEPIRGVEGRYRVFGGTTVAWTGRSARLDPIDLAKRDWIAESGWPISYRALADHYPVAAALVGLEGAWDDEPAQFARLRAMPGRPSDVEPYLWRFHSFRRGTFQHFGEMVYRAFASPGGPRVLLEANLVGMSARAERGEVDALEFIGRDGKTVRVEGRRFILCCGGIENARLMLNVAANRPALLAAASPALGRYFMQHPRAPTARIVADARQADGLQRLFNYFRRPGRHHESGFALSEVAQRRDALLQASAVLRYAPRTANLRPDRALTALMQSASGRQPSLYRPDIALHVDIEQVPDPDSRIMLTEERDAIGLRKAAIDWRIHRDDRRTATAMTHAAGSWIAQLGLGTACPLPDLEVTGGLTGEYMLESFHHLGTTRMSAQPGTGVVDPDLRVHGVDNLYLCGGSVLPTGGHANPTLTILALAIRLADHLSS